MTDTVTDTPLIDGGDVISLDANVDGTGGTISGKPVLTLEQIEANLNRTNYPGTGIPGPMWAYGTDFMGQNKSGDPGVIQFAFYHSRSELFQIPYVYQQGSGLVGRSEYFGFAPFSAAQQDAARKALTLWDDLINVKIVEVTDVNKADITYGNLTNAPQTQAYAYLPYNYGGTSAGLQGDVWVSTSQASNLQLGNGFYGLATLIHETGHALGLQHPGAYNAAPGVSITYGANAEYYQDSRQYTQMSYFNAEFTGGAAIDWNRLTWVYGQTPLLHDIATIQAMYGADPNTRTGNTVYGFNATADRDVYNFATNTMPVISIYDAGGNDTLDFSGWNSNSKIDLHPGSFSSGGGSGVVPLDVLKARGLLPPDYTEAQYLALRTRYIAADGLLHDNISIAYNTIIENAIGGGGNDVIIGNDVGNVLEGRGGDDTITGNAGNDTLNGGLGADSMAGGTGDDIYFVDNGGDLVAELTGEGTDTVNASISYVLTDNVENLTLTGTAADGTGNALDNVIVGDAADNHLFGGAGNDTLAGGAGGDQLRGRRRQRRPRRRRRSGRDGRRHGRRHLHRRQCRRSRHRGRGPGHGHGEGVDQLHARRQCRESGPDRQRRGRHRERSRQHPDRQRGFEPPERRRGRRPAGRRRRGRLPHRRRRQRRVRGRDQPHQGRQQDRRDLARPRARLQAGRGQDRPPRHRRQHARRRLPVVQLRRPGCGQECRRPLDPALRQHGRRREGAGNGARRFRRQEPVRRSGHRAARQCRRRRPGLRDGVRQHADAAHHRPHPLRLGSAQAGREALRLRPGRFFPSQRPAEGRPTGGVAVFGIRASSGSSQEGTSPPKLICG
jgi:serralysin